jgi:hypothetical protein
MYPTSTPQAVSASQFEDLSRELFIGLQRAAKMRMAAASQPYPLLVLPPAEERLRPLPPLYQKADRQALLTH